ncbi:hypothetical protein AMAG_19045 [Allomyces macrogynus ATCC 38327]|uniref:Uncharacterized protein n=1 Tax=Allomyces macrogynus (strain ATCC 38327) TaxID=578462 RepID=A0A0L0SMK8_ALLM3|nr:hypothetical protein AMAG_19045 [Allomyces macrogynus ATCC 38327]|eukprot:KNE63722.1 hypothetical protein AMAG_19045 [Allomyces macrogynus ATCC 38327]
MYLAQDGVADAHKDLVINLAVKTLPHESPTSFAMAPLKKCQFATTTATTSRAIPTNAWAFTSLDLGRKRYSDAHAFMLSSDQSRLVTAFASGGDTW